MTEEQNINSLINNLDERTKELHCIYQVDEALNDFVSDIEIVLNKVIAIIPDGLRFTDICKAKITYEEIELSSEGYKETELKLSSRVTIDNKVLGEIAVVYIKPIKTEKRIFLSEEITLINTIASKLSNFFLLRKLRQTIKEMGSQNGLQTASKEDDLYIWLKNSGLKEDEIEYDN